MQPFSAFLMEREYNVFDDSTINEMANLSKQTTHLPIVIYVSDNRGVNHGPRIKCNCSYGNWSGQSFTVTIDHEPRAIGKTGDIKPSDVQTVLDWVKINYDCLIKYWKLEIGIGELIAALQSI